jgi:hypothetical protein
MSLNGPTHNYLHLYCLGEAARLHGDLDRADALLSESCHSL